MRLRTLGVAVALAATTIAAPGAFGASRSTGAHGPAGTAAASAPLAYSCTVLGQTRTFTGVVDTDAPTKLAYGQTAAATVSLALTVPEDVTATFRDDLKAASVEGAATVSGKVGKKKTPWATPFARTSLPATGSLVLTGTVAGPTFSGRKIGRMWRVRAGDLSADLRFYRADGQPTSPIPGATVSCTLPPDQVPLADTVTVVKDTTTTTVIGKDTAVGARGRVKIKVASAYGTRTRGDVRVKIFHRGEKVSERVVALEKKAKVKIRTRKLTERGWSVTAKYLGSETLRGSRGADKIKVR